MGERAYRDDIDAGAGDVAYGGEIDVAAGFHECTARDEGDSLPQFLEREVIEHDRIDTSGKYRLDLDRKSVV